MLLLVFGSNPVSMFRLSIKEASTLQNLCGLRSKFSCGLEVLSDVLLIKCNNPCIVGASSFEIEFCVLRYLVP